MSTSNPSEINAQKPAVPTVKKDAQSSGSAESSVPSKSLPLAESRCYGVSVGVGVSSALVAYGIAADLCAAGSIFGLPVEQQKNVEIFAADHVSASDLKFQVSRFVDGEANISVIVPKTQTPPDYRSQEGRALMGRPKAEGCHVVVVPAANKKARWSEANLSAFKRAVAGKGALIIFIFQGFSKEEEAYLSSCFNGVFTVCRCEPDKGYSSAVMATPLPGSFLAATGHSAVIENIRVDAEGRVERHCLPCVSPDRLDREIYRLREEKKSLEEIGEALGYNKSTISRRLGALPFHLRGDRL